MKIYAQSRGSSPDFDYTWQPEVPSFLSRVSGYIQSESPSVVLCRFDGHLFLLVTSLESPTKRDFTGRTIYHSVAWICEDNNDNEKALRAIAYQALQHRDDLTAKVDRLIQLDRRKGFTFEPIQFEDLSDSTLYSFKLESSDNDPDNTIKIAKNSQELQIALALELQTSRLPSEYELLVVVTGIKSEDSLAQANIWRSLSNLVQSENWKPVFDKKEDLLPKKLIMAIILILLLVIAIILWILLVH